MTPRKDEDAWGIWCNGNTAVCGTAIQRSTRCFPTICRIYLHTAGKKEEKAEFESARESLLIKTVTSVRRNTVTFLRVFRW